MRRSTLRLSFPRRRESRADTPPSPLGLRPRGTDGLKFSTFKENLLRPETNLHAANCRRSHPAVDPLCVPDRQDSRRALGYDSYRMVPEVVDWQSQPWDDLVPRLLSLAASRLLRMTWRGRRRGQPPGAAEAADFVNDAIFKTIKGIRRWDPQACSLLEHLASVVVSDISHIAVSKENRTLLDNPGDPDEQFGAEVKDDAPSQESEAHWRSEQRRLLAYLGGVDPALRQIAALMLQRDMTDSAELGRELKLDLAEVANLRKRLKRAIRAYLAEFKP